MQAMMTKAKLYGADLSKSNLFAANLGMVRTDDATRVQGANLKRALMLPRIRKDQGKVSNTRCRGKTSSSGSPTVRR